MAELIYKDEAYAIVGACFEIYKDKGCGFVEPVYQDVWRLSFNTGEFLSKLNRKWICSTGDAD